MNPVFAVFLTVLLGSSMYLAGRLHARVGYRFGYRYGYRQGYYDGDRACWNRVRRGVHTGEMVETVTVPAPRAAAPGDADQDFVPGAGTMYAGSAVPGNRRGYDHPAG